MTMTHRVLIAAVALLVGIGSFWPLEKAVGDTDDTQAVTAAAAAVEEGLQQNNEDTRTASDTARRRTVGSNTTEIESKPPQLLEGPPPQCPVAAKKAGVDAEVVVRIRVTADGTVDSVIVDVKSKSHAEDFEKSVRDVVYKWRFKPAETDDAKRRKAWVQTKILFKLDDCDGDTKGDKSSKTGVKPRSEPVGGNG
ncbi:MAG: energy transducer TonB, partial [bacterium]